MPEPYIRIHGTKILVRNTLAPGDLGTTTLGIFWLQKRQIAVSFAIRWTLRRADGRAKAFSYPWSEPWNNLECCQPPVHPVGVCNTAIVEDREAGCSTGIERETTSSLWPCGCGGSWLV
jgi:hypothetical protein